MEPRGEAAAPAVDVCRQPARRVEVRRKAGGVGSRLRPQQDLRIDDDGVCAAGPHVSGVHVAAAQQVDEGEEHARAAPVGDLSDRIGGRLLRDVGHPAVRPAIGGRRRQQLEARALLGEPREDALERRLHVERSRLVDDASSDGVAEHDDAVADGCGTRERQRHAEAPGEQLAVGLDPVQELAAAPEPVLGPQRHQAVELGQVVRASSRPPAASAAAYASYAPAEPGSRKRQPGTRRNRSRRTGAARPASSAEPGHECVGHRRREHRPGRAGAVVARQRGGEPGAERVEAPARLGEPAAERLHERGVVDAGHRQRTPSGSVRACS